MKTTIFFRSSLVVSKAWNAILCTSVVSLLALPSVSSAVIFDWSPQVTTGTSTSAPANWLNSSDQSRTTLPGALDIARWNTGNYTAAPTVITNGNLGQMLFDAGNAAGVTFGAGASTLTLFGVNNYGIVMNNLSGNVSTGGAKFAIAASQTWQNNSSTNTLTIGGTITNSATNTPLTLTIDGVGATLLNGVISNGAGTSTTALTKTGNGTLTLGAANSFTGGVSLNNGKLILGNNAALGGAASTLTIAAGTTIDVSGNRTTTNNNAQVWNGDWSYGGSFTWNTGSGSVTLGASTQLSNLGANLLTVGGAITGTGDLTLKPGSTGGITLTNANNTGAITNSGGGSGTVTLTTVGSNVTAITQSSNSSPLVVTNALTGLGGSNTFNISKSNIAVSGGGSLTLTGGVNNNGTITNDNTGTGTLTIGAIGSNVTNITQNSANTTMVLNGANAYNNANGYNIQQGTLSISNATTFTNATKFSLSSGGRLDVNVANQSLAKLTTGVVAGSYLRYSQAQTTGGTGPGTIYGTVELNITNVNPNYTLDFGAGSTLTNLVASTYTAPITLSGNASINSSTAAATYSTGGITASTTGAKTLTLQGSNTGANTVSSIIGDGSGSIGIIKAGAGTWSLSGVNTFTGGVAINAGELDLTTTASASGASTNTITLGDTTNGNSNNATLGLLVASGTYGNNITVAAGSLGTLTIKSTSGQGGATISGNLILNNNLTVTDTALKIIAFNGSTTVGSGAIAVNTTGNLNTQFTGGVVLGGGGLTFNEGSGSGGTITIGTGNITGSGPLTLNANIGNITVSAASINHTGNITNSGSGTGTTTISGVIGTNVTGVIQNSANSTLALNATNLFTSGLTVKSGTVSTNNAAGFGGTGGGINLGDTGSNTNNATLLSTGNVSHANAITVNAGSSGILSILGQTNSQTFSGGVTLHNALTLANLTAGKATTFSGVISGTSGLNIGNTGITNSGTVALSNANTFSGDTLVNSGTLSVSNSLALQNSALDTTGAGTVALSSVTTPTFGGLKGSKDLASVITSGYTGVTALTLNPGTGVSNTYSGVIANGASNMNLVKTGSGTQILVGTNTYTGATTINGGLLKVNGSLANTAVAINSGGKLGGGGTIVGTVAVNSGGVLSPGNSPGTLNTGAMTFGAGGTYQWEINKADGGKGTDPGWDWNNISGTLNITASNSDGSRFIIDITGLDATNAAGQVVNWNATGTYHWTIATASSIIGFDTGKFTLNTSNFANNNTATTSQFSLSSTGTDLVLNYVGSNNSALSLPSTAVVKVLAGKSATQNISVTNSGSNSGDYTAAAGGSTTLSGTTGTVAGSSSSTIAVGYSDNTSVGARSGTAVSIGNTSNGTDASNHVTTLAAGSGVYAAASLSKTQSTSNNTTTINLANASGSYVASAEVSAVNLTNYQAGFSTSFSATTIASGSSAAVAQFDGTGKLNGTYKGTLGYTARNDSSIAGSAANDLNGSTALSVSISGHTSASRTSTSSAQILSGGEFAGYGLTSSVSGGKGTVAKLLGGTASALTTVSMSFDSTLGAAGTDSINRHSDILTLSGINVSDTFVLQMSYDPNASAGDKYIVVFNTTLHRWVNAISGNNDPATLSLLDGGQGIGHFELGDYKSSYTLGYYGYNDSTKTAWAVLDNTNSAEFAVVPEPSSWAMLVGGLGMLAFGQRLRRRSNA